MQAMTKQNVVIFGATGFLGTKIFEYFTHNGDYNINSPAHNEVDLTDQIGTTQFIASQPDNTLFINCAALVGSVHSGMEREIAIIEENTRINLNIFSALAALNRKFALINFLSNCIYPETVHQQREEQLYDGSPHHTARAYAHAKRHAMQMFNILSDKQHSTVHQLILPGLFGAGNHLDEERLHAFDAIIVRMIKAKRNNDKSFKVYGTGKPIREWVPASSVAAAAHMINLSQKESPTVLNFSINFSESIWDTTLRVQRLLGYKGDIIQDPNYVDGAPIKILNNSVFLKTYTEFTPKINIDAEVMKSIKYYEKHL